MTDIDPLPNQIVHTPQAAIASLEVLDEMGRRLGVYPLDRPTTTVGRHDTNDLPLHNPQVSGGHLHIDWDGTTAYITDDTSRNGTTRNGELLQPQETYVWLPGEIVCVGPYQLRLMASPEREHASRDDYAVIGNARPVISETPDLRLTLAADEWRLTPGRAETLGLKLQNVGRNVGVWRIVVEGVPSSWLDVPAEGVELYPGDVAEAPLYVAVPPQPAGKPGVYQVTVRALKAGEAEIEEMAAHATWIVAGDGTPERAPVLPASIAGGDGATVDPPVLVLKIKADEKAPPAPVEVALTPVKIQEAAKPEPGPPSRQKVRQEWPMATGHTGLFARKANLAATQDAGQSGAAKAPALKPWHGIALGVVLLAGIPTTSWLYAHRKKVTKNQVVDPTSTKQFVHPTSTQEDTKAPAKNSTPKENATATEPKKEAHAAQTPKQRPAQKQSQEQPVTKTYKASQIPGVIVKKADQKLEKADQRLEKTVDDFRNMLPGNR